MNRNETCVFEDVDAKISVAGHNHIQYLEYIIRHSRFDKGLSTHLKKVTIHKNSVDKWEEWIKTTLDGFIRSASSYGEIIEYDPKSMNYMYEHHRGKTVEIHCYGDEEWVNETILEIEDTFDVMVSFVDWVYDAEGRSVEIPLNTERMPIKEMYPFLGEESLEDYYDKYLDSSANILLLIGPPGTGKTTFIRGLLAHSEGSALVSYDSAILEHDSFFARFISSDADVMVLEDSDNFLRPRSDGNTMMHRFLNVGDGLVTTKGKKMIFSTNLPSVRDIDSALTRPGRCFDILEFRPLNRPEAILLGNKLGVQLPFTDQTEYSIAEIFGEQKHTPNKRPFGFI